MLVGTGCVLCFQGGITDQKLWELLVKQERSWGRIKLEGEAGCECGNQKTVGGKAPGRQENGRGRA